MSKCCIHTVMCIAWRLWHVKENRYSDREETDGMNIKFVTFPLFAAVSFLKSVSFFHNLTSCWKRKVKLLLAQGIRYLLRGLGLI